jgi:DNA-binding NarL/FixJ family response regulator
MKSDRAQLRTLAPTTIDTPYTSPPASVYEENTMTTISCAVHIMHPDHVIASGLLVTLANRAEFCVTTHATQPHAAHAAQVVIADHAIGIDLARQRQRAAILVITSYDRECEVRSALECGVKGYVMLSAGSDEIVAAVCMVGRGQRYVSDSVMLKIADSYSREPLTRRENDVLHLLAEGCCNKTIARRLGIGQGTVKSHLRSVMAKLGVHARTQAVIVATERGMVAPRPHAAPVRPGISSVSVARAA